MSRPTLGQLTEGAAALALAWYALHVGGYVGERAARAARIVIDSGTVCYVDEVASAQATAAAHMFCAARLYGGILADTVETAGQGASFAASWPVAAIGRMTK